MDGLYNALRQRLTATKDNQIFISHSSKDEKETKFFRSFFDDTNVKPVFMEFEKWSRNNYPNWFWIKKEIQKSKALFVVLTRNITSRPHTQNWVAFEIGVAASCKPPLPIFVFREEDVDFPVPYLTWYFDEPVSTLDYLKPQDFSEMLLDFIIVLFKYQVLAHAVSESVFESNQENEYSHRCTKCYLQFNYFGMNEKIHCPCCSNLMDTDMQDK